MWLSRWPVLGEVHPKKNFTNSLAWSSFKRDVGIRNIATFLKFNKTNLEAIYLIRFPNQTRHCDIIPQLRITHICFKK